MKLGLIVVGIIITGVSALDVYYQNYAIAQDGLAFVLWIFSLVIYSKYLDSEEEYENMLETMEQIWTREGIEQKYVDPICTWVQSKTYKELLHYCEAFTHYEMEDITDEWKLIYYFPYNTELFHIPVFISPSGAYIITVMGNEKSVSKILKAEVDDENIVLTQQLEGLILKMYLP